MPKTGLPMRKAEHFLAWRFSFLKHCQFEQFFGQKGWIEKRWQIISGFIVCTMVK
jgi:hypothetical protein